MIVHTFGPFEDCIDTSPFVVKLLTWLRMAGLPYETKIGNLRKMPNKKLPAITLDDGRVMVDSQDIIEHLTLAHHDPLKEAEWSRTDQAVACAWRALFETDLYFSIVYYRWVLEDNFALLSPSIAAYLGTMGVPRFLRPMIVRKIRRDTIAQLNAQGTGRRPLQRINAYALHSAAAVSDFLGDKPYFLGDRPCALDATVFAFLHSLLRGPMHSPLEGFTAECDNLVDYHQRMLDQYWSEEGTA